MATTTTRRRTDSLACFCNLPLQPVKWSDHRTLWCCSKINLPEALRFKSPHSENEGYHCTKVLEFLNNNDKSPQWHWLNDRLTASCFSLTKLCQSKLSNSLLFPYARLWEMIECLNSYDPNLEHDYDIGTKKRKAIQNSRILPPPPKRRRVTHKHKLDPVALNGQLELFAFPSITFAKNESDTLKRNNEIREEEKRKWVADNCRQCRCFETQLVEKRIVKQFDDQGNVKRNAGRSYWACNECNYFLWEEDDDPMYNYYVDRTLRK
jgi:hypothetical protein